VVVAVVAYQSMLSPGFEPENRPEFPGMVWSPFLCQQLMEKSTMPGVSYSTIGPVAERVGIPRWRLAYLIERGDVPGPSLQIPGRRLFSEEDVDHIRAALNDQREGHNPGTSVQR
jgi:hypothetical protein